MKSKKDFCGIRQGRGRFLCSCRQTPSIHAQTTNRASASSRRRLGALGGNPASPRSADKSPEAFRSRARRNTAQIRRESQDRVEWACEKDMAHDLQKYELLESCNDASVARSFEEAIPLRTVGRLTHGRIRHFEDVEWMLHDLGLCTTSRTD
jgi:hypothetical protein